MNTEKIMQEIEELVRTRCEASGMTPEDGMEGALACAAYLAIRYGLPREFQQCAKRLIAAMEDVRVERNN